MSLPIVHPAIRWGSEEDRAAHATWVDGERVRRRAARLARALRDFIFMTCVHARHDAAADCPACVAAFYGGPHPSRATVAITSIDAAIAIEDDASRQAPPVFTIGEHWTVLHPEARTVVEGLLMGGYPGHPGDLALHPLSGGKGQPHQTIRLTPAWLLAHGRRWA